MSGILRRGAAPLLDRVACSRSFGSAMTAWQRWRGDQSFAVLTYHRVGGEDDPFFLGIAAADFAAQMRCLARHCNVLPLAELLRRASERVLPPGAVGVSFDDSYACVHEVAWPIMRELGIPATVFVPTAPLLGGEPLWYDRVLHAFKHATASRLDADSAPGTGPLALHEEASRLRAAEAVLVRLRQVGEVERDAAVRQLERSLRPAAWRCEPALRHGTIDQLRRHADEGLDVGAHSVTHPIFAGLQPLRQRAELRECRGHLEGWLQRSVDLFAYPNGRAGDFDADTVEELHAAGYNAAFTTEAGINAGDWEQDRFRLRRIDAAGTAVGRLMLRLAALRIAA